MLSGVMCHVSCVTCHMFHATSNVSHVACHVLHFICCMSYVACHLLHITKAKTQRFINPCQNITSYKLFIKDCGGNGGKSGFR